MFVFEQFHFNYEQSLIKGTLWKVGNLHTITLYARGHIISTKGTWQGHLGSSLKKSLLFVEVTPVRTSLNFNHSETFITGIINVGPLREPLHYDVLPGHRTRLSVTWQGHVESNCYFFLSFFLNAPVRTGLLQLQLNFVSYVHYGNLHVSMYFEITCQCQRAHKM